MPSKDNLNKNLIFNSLYQIINVITPLIIIPKISRVFGPDFIGLKSYSFSIVYYFAIFGVLGLDMYGQRLIAINRDNKIRYSEIFCNIFLTRFILVLISLCLYLAYVHFFIVDSYEHLVFLCWSFYLIRDMINPIWFLQGLEKYTMVSCFEIFSQLSYAFCVFFFINQKYDLYRYIIFFTAIPLVVSLLYLLISIYLVKIIRPEPSKLIKCLKESVIYFIPTIATAIYSMVDKTMLGIYDRTLLLTGLYESTEKLVKVALAFSTSIFTIVRSRMSYIWGLNNVDVYKTILLKFIRLSMFLCWPIMLGIIGIVKDFVPLFFGASFMEVIDLTYLYVLVIPLITISGLIQATYIYPSGRQAEMNKYYCIIVFTNILLNIILINFLSIYGALISSILSEALLVFILLKSTNGIIRLSMFCINSWKNFLSSILMLIMIKIASHILILDYLNKLILEVSVGMISYCLFNIILKDSLSLGLYYKIKKRLSHRY